MTDLLPFPGSLDGGALDSGALDVAARRLADHAAEVRRLAADLGLAAAGSGWRSTAATACETRLADLARDLLGAAALLDHAATLVADHARVAARRADALAQAARELATGGLLGVVLP